MREIRINSGTWRMRFILIECDDDKKAVEMILEIISGILSDDIEVLDGQALELMMLLRPDLFDVLRVDGVRIWVKR